MTEVSNQTRASSSLLNEELPSDMADALDRFNQTAEAFTVKFLGKLETEPAPPTLYHYTDRRGLEGIMSSGTLWFSDIFTMNDPSELKYGLSQAAEMLRGMVKVNLPETKSFSDKFATLLLEGGAEAVAHYFTCSLSTAGDDSGMWSAYAENGRGFSLEFDGPQLDEIYTKHPDGSPVSNNCTFRVTYDGAKLRDILGNIFESAFPLISAPRGRGLSSNQNRRYNTDLLVTVALHSLRCGLFFKREGYADEREYRFLQVFRGDQAAPPVKLKPGSGIRYREFDWKSRGLAALKRITVGPTAEGGTEDFVRKLLSANGFRRVTVDRSFKPHSE